MKNSGTADQVNKKKIINDPVYGFINLYDDIIYE